MLAVEPKHAYFASQSPFGSDCSEPNNAMTSPDRASFTSSSSHRDSIARSSISSYLSVPSRRSSNSQQRRASSQHSSLSKRTKLGYISPYPALDPQTPSQSTATANPTTATAQGQATPTTSAQPSASSTTASHEDDDHSDSNDHDEESEAETTQKLALIEALNEHRVNTLSELARIEKIFATLGSPDLTQPMTSAWIYYVNSNSLLAEIRTLTRNYPFSSECLDEAKRRVYQDPHSNRSWNYCWLVLAKVHTDRLIPMYARIQASKPEMWGRRHQPTTAQVEQLTQAFVKEWTAALQQLLRHWETAPTKPPSPTSISPIIES